VCSQNSWHGIYTRSWQLLERCLELARLHCCGQFTPHSHSLDAVREWHENLQTHETIEELDYNAFNENPHFDSSRLRGLARRSSGAGCILLHNLRHPRGIFMVWQNLPEVQAD
jgi:hypothetical protein